MTRTMFLAARHRNESRLRDMFRVDGRNVVPKFIWDPITSLDAAEIISEAWFCTALVAKSTRPIQSKNKSVISSV